MTSHHLGDNRVIEACGEGKLELECHDGTDNITMNLHKVLSVPEIRKRQIINAARYERNIMHQI